MAFSKIILNGVTQIDLTQDTVASNNLIAPNIAHGADGNQVTGTAVSETDYLPASISNELTIYENNSITYLRKGAFFGAGNLKSLKLYGVTSIADQAFVDTGLSVLVFPELTTVRTTTYAFRFSGSKIDLGKLATIGANVFNNCANLKTVILRSATMASLANVNAFNNSPFKSGGAGGTLYVPSALKSQYESATNWSTILGFANNSITTIEGSEYENYYADGTPIPTA